MGLIEIKRLHRAQHTTTLKSWVTKILKYQGTSTNPTCLKEVAIRIDALIRVKMGQIITIRRTILRWSKVRLIWPWFVIIMDRASRLLVSKWIELLQIPHHSLCRNLSTTRLEYRRAWEIKATLKRHLIKREEPNQAELRRKQPNQLQNSTSLCFSNSLGH